MTILALRPLEAPMKNGVLKLHRPREPALPSNSPLIWRDWLLRYLRTLAKQGMTAAELQMKYKGALTRAKHACYALSKQGLIEDSGLRRQIKTKGSGCFPGKVYRVTKQGKRVLAQKGAKP